MAGPRQHLKLLSLTLLALLMAAPAAAQTPVIRLPVRFHLVTTREPTLLGTTRTAQDVRTLLSVANTIWAQAGIEWVLESVRTVESTQAGAFEALVNGTAQVDRRRGMLAILRPDSLLTPGWNIFLIGQFGMIAGGWFMAELSGAVLAERGMGIDLLPEARGGGTLAHELGHSFGLPHEVCDDTRNIMANGCWLSAERARLTAGQIATARAQAAAGRPIVVEPDWQRP